MVGQTASNFTRNQMVTYCDDHAQRTLALVSTQSPPALNDVSPLAASCTQTLAKNQHLTPGIFTALHTFGRDLKWNVHVHLSTTCGGLTTHGNWQQLYYKKQTLMRMWRYRVVDLLREAHKNGTLKLPRSPQYYCPTHTAFNAWLGRRYKKQWILHCAKPTNNHTHTVNYLGRYIKRPPLSQSRLKHYNGQHVQFNFHDHKSKKQKTFHASASEFIRRFIQHIPDKHFRIVRYYRFLANRNRKTLLPKVYDALDQSERKQFFFSFAYLYKQTFGRNPLDCILCNTKMKLASIKPGLSLKKLIPHHQNIALAKPIIL